MKEDCVIKEDENDISTQTEIVMSGVDVKQVPDNQTVTQQTQSISSQNLCRGGSRTAATSKMERLVIIVNGWKPLTIITKRSILDVAAVLDPLLYAAYLICSF